MPRGAPVNPKNDARISKFLSEVHTSPKAQVSGADHVFHMQKYTNAVVVACAELSSKRTSVTVYRSRGRYNNHLGIITHDRCSLDMNVN